MEKKFRLVDLERKKVIAEGIHLIGEFMLDGGIHSYIKSVLKKNGSYLEYYNNIRVDIFSGKQDETGKDIYENDLANGYHRDMGEITNLKTEFDSDQGFIFCKNGKWYPFNKISRTKVIGIHYAT